MSPNKFDADLVLQLEESVISKRLGSNESEWQVISGKPGVSTPFKLSMQRGVGSDVYFAE